MRSIKIALIIILFMITAGLCGILVYGMTGGNPFGDSNRQHYAEAQLVLEKEIPLDGIDSISVLYGMNNNDIYLFQSESDTAIVREYSSSEMNEKELSIIKVNDNSLEIRGVRRSYNSGFHLFYYNNYAYNRHYTEVYLPASYCGELLLETASGDIISDLDIELEKDFSIISTSGDVNFFSVTADNVSINTSSGYVEMEDIDTDVNGSGGEVSIKTSSGDVDLKEITGKTNIESSSGYLTVGTIVGDVQLKTSSGDMNIKEIMGATTTESSSGNVTIRTLTGDAQLKTSSGDVDIQHADGSIRAMTTSGYVRILEGDGDREASTSSGDITVEGEEGTFLFNTQSGDIQINMQKGEGSMESTSGDVQVGLTELAGNLHITSSSGYVSISISDQNEFDFLTNTTSGDIKTFFDDDLKFSSRRDSAQGTYGANAQGNRIEIQTTSGDVRISKY